MYEYERKGTTDFLVGYLEHYAILYSRSDDKYIQLDLKTGKSSPIDFTGHIVTSQTINDTSLYFWAETTLDCWMMALQEDGTIKVDKLTILDEVNTSKSDSMSILFSSSGEFNLLSSVDVRDVNDIVTKYYTLDFA